MTIQDFDNYLDNCKICNHEMLLMAEFDVLTHSLISTDQLDFQFAGSIVFFYEGNGKFGKGYAFDEMHKGVAQKAHDITINSFTINKRIYPNLRRTKIMDAIHPLGLDAIPLSIVKQCVENSSHTYGYRTEIINEFDNNNPNALDIDNEFLQIHNHQIMNLLKNNEHYRTDIIEFDSPQNKITLPPISFDKWNTEDKEIFSKQIEKYSMLL